MTDPTDPNPSGDSRRDRHAQRGNFAGTSIVGLVIILVGVIFLARNFGLDFPLPDRWWAFFVLIPAAASLVSAARFYRVDGRLSNRVAGAMTGGVLMLAVALILFLDLDWGAFWPVLVIIVGLGIVLRGVGRGDR